MNLNWKGKMENSPPAKIQIFEISEGEAQARHDDQNDVMLSEGDIIQRHMDMNRDIDSLEIERKKEEALEAEAYDLLSKRSSPEPGTNEEERDILIITTCPEENTKPVYGVCTKIQSCSPSYKVKEETPQRRYLSMIVKKDIMEMMLEKNCAKIAKNYLRIREDNEELYEFKNTAWRTAVSGNIELIDCSPTNYTTECSDLIEVNPIHKILAYNMMVYFGISKGEYNKVDFNRQTYWITEYDNGNVGITLESQVIVNVSRFNKLFTAKQKFLFDLFDMDDAEVHPVLREIYSYMKGPKGERNPKDFFTLSAFKNPFNQKNGNTYQVSYRTDGLTGYFRTMEIDDNRFCMKIPEDIPDKRQLLQMLEGTVFYSANFFTCFMKPKKVTIEGVNTLEIAEKKINLHFGYIPHKYATIKEAKLSEEETEALYMKHGFLYKLPSKKIELVKYAFSPQNIAAKQTEMCDRPNDDQGFVQQTIMHHEKYGYELAKRLLRIENYGEESCKKLVKEFLDDVRKPLPSYDEFREADWKDKLKLFLQYLRSRIYHNEAEPCKIHLYLLGKTNAGKTTLMKYLDMILQDEFDVSWMSKSLVERTADYNKQFLMLHDEATRTLTNPNDHMAETFSKFEIPAQQMYKPNTKKNPPYGVISMFSVTKDIDGFEAELEKWVENSEKCDEFNRRSDQIDQLKKRIRPLDISTGFWDEIMRMKRSVTSNRRITKYFTLGMASAGLSYLIRRMLAEDEREAKDNEHKQKETGEEIMKKILKFNPASL